MYEHNRNIFFENQASKLKQQRFVPVYKHTRPRKDFILFTLYLPQVIKSHSKVFNYLLLKLYSKYKIERDRNITHDTDINIKEKKLKTFKNMQINAHAAHCS